jgi:hypothetical protein
MSVDKKSWYYDAGGIETINVIKAKLTPEQFKGYLLGNLIKYSSRANFKGSFERDIEKVVIYSGLLDKEKDREAEAPKEKHGESESQKNYSTYLLSKMSLFQRSLPPELRCELAQFVNDNVNLHREVEALNIALKSVLIKLKKKVFQYEKDAGKVNPFVAAEGEKNPFVASEGEKNPFVAAEGEKNPFVASEGEKNPFVASEEGRTQGSPLQEKGYRNCSERRIFELLNEWDRARARAQKVRG